MLPIHRFGVCRSSDLSIHMQETFFPHKRIASAFSRSHDSPSNDRFSPHAGIPHMENNTLELQLLSESCRVLAISNVQTAILRRIPSVSGIYTRFPCSANKYACPRGFRRLDGKSCLPRLLGSRICHKSHGIQFTICAPNFTHAKRPLLLCYLADKRSLVFSVYSV